MEGAFRKGKFPVSTQISRPVLSKADVTNKGRQVFAAQKFGEHERPSGRVLSTVVIGAVFDVDVNAGQELARRPRLAPAESDGVGWNCRNPIMSPVGGFAGICVLCVAVLHC